MGGLNVLTKSESSPEAYSEPCRTSKIKRFAKIVKGFQPLTTSAKRSVF